MPLRVLAGWVVAGLAVAMVACGTVDEVERRPAFTNPHVVAEDRGERVPGTYFFRRAWVQVTRDLRRTEVPPVQGLDVAALAHRPFAVSWLGHSALLVRVGPLWVLIDPMLTGTAGPVAGLGPARLTALPWAGDAATALPRIDVVLVSHDHYDHLDLPSVRRLAAQPGGPPRFFVGRGLDAWFRAHVLPGDAQAARPFGWWDAAEVDGVRFTFVPAQHNSGRTPATRNRTLWGGWVIEHRVLGTPRRFYFAGDTAYVKALFTDIRQRIGPIDLAALPIGAYRPRALMRFEHTDPDDAVQAHLDLGATRSFGVHWGTFQLGDEEPFDAARDLALSVRRRQADGFGLVPIGGVLDVVGDGARPDGWVPAALLPAARAR